MPPDIEETIKEKNMDNYTAYEQYMKVADPLLTVPKSYHDAILQIQLFADSIKVEHEYTLVPLEKIKDKWWNAELKEDVRIQWMVDQDKKKIVAARKIYDSRKLEAVLCLTLDYDKIFSPLQEWQKGEGELRQQTAEDICCMKIFHLKIWIKKILPIRRL